MPGALGYSGSSISAAPGFFRGAINRLNSDAHFFASPVLQNQRANIVGNYVYHVGEFFLGGKGIDSALGFIGRSFARSIPAVTALVPKGSVALGKWGESRLAQVLKNTGVKPSKAYITTRGARYVDRLVEGIAHEAKGGLNVRLSSKLKTQILKDHELIMSNQIRGAHWHFFQGAHKSITDFLTEKSIPYTIH